MPAKILTRRAFALGLGSTLASPAEAKPRAVAKPQAKKEIKPRPSAEDLAFAKFVQSLWPEAKKEGVSRKTFDAAFRGVDYDPKIVAHTEGQAEFVTPIWQYLDAAVSAKRVENGKTKYAEQKSWIDKAEKDFGVSAAVIMGVWGIETGYGVFQGSDYVIRALASLALSKYQPEYFRSELIAALKILEDGDIEPKNMLGSWAGAMGQTQFMPSSYLKYAVDFDAKGRRDIWNDAADAIGSTANYLNEHGWKRDDPWGFEVTLPDRFGLKAEDFDQIRGVLVVGVAGGQARRRRTSARRGRRSVDDFRRPQGADLPHHRQFQDDQDLQQLDLVCARGLAARQRHSRRPGIARRLAGQRPPAQQDRDRGIADAAQKNGLL